MKSDEFNRVDQAIFGYSNGHRGLASSISLSQVDSYELATASDLAPGIQLDPQQSYITGMILPESRKYALIRTWLAPEMPRPGCVWSHVLVLDRQVLSTQADLTVLNQLFRRPSNYLEDASLASSISISRRAKGQSARKEVIEQVLAACYTSAKLNIDTGPDLENAILAVWSQQWPRLRAAFVFRSMISTAELKGQSLHFDHGSSQRKLIGTSRWIDEAAIDATSETITPLRRFLWRYGKDIETSRRTFPFLVNLFLDTRDRSVDPLIASSAFNQFDPGQAETLKRDLLGLSRSKLSLVPALNVVDLVKLVATQEPEALGLEGDEMAALLGAARPGDLPEIALALETVKQRASPLFGELLDALIPLADEDCLIVPSMPHWFLFEVLSRRSELITEKAASHLSRDELVSLTRGDIASGKIEVILSLVFGLEYSDDLSSLLDKYPWLMFRIGVKLHLLAKLSNSWVEAFRLDSLRFVPFVKRFDSGDLLASAIDLLDYPISEDDSVAFWHSRLGEYWDTTSSKSQGNVLVYIFVLCIKSGVSRNRIIVRDVLPPLRKRILSSEFSPEARSMLDRWLPAYRDGWDLHHRLLKLFRQEYKRGENLDEVISAIYLTDKEYAYATNQDVDNIIRAAIKMFTPRTFWD